MTCYPPRLLTLVTPPEYEIITLAEAKLFLRVDGNEEDSLISDLITAAREKSEAWLRRSLLTQRWQLQQAFVPAQRVKLPLGPIQEIESVSTTRLGQTTTLTSLQYRYFPESQELEIDAGMDADRVTVTYISGYTDASKIPAAIRQGVLHTLSHYYHQRESAADLSAEAKRLMGDYREMRL